MNNFQIFMNQLMNKLEFIKKCVIAFFTMAFIYLVVKVINACSGNWGGDGHLIFTLDFTSQCL